MEVIFYHKSRAYYVDLRALLFDLTFRKLCSHIQIYSARAQTMCSMFKPVLSDSKLPCSCSNCVLALGHSCLRRVFPLARRKVLLSDLCSAHGVSVNCQPIEDRLLLTNQIIPTSMLLCGCVHCNSRSVTYGRALFLPGLSISAPQAVKCGGSLYVLTTFGIKYQLINTRAPVLFITIGSYININ